MYRLEYHPLVYDDLSHLSLDILQEVADYFKKYKTDPYKYSQKLYNQGSLNLKGYRKTYVANATYRIVIKREDKSVYKEAFSRTQK